LSHVDSIKKQKLNVRNKINTMKNTASARKSKSLRGLKGTVGAPPKTIKFPRGAFTIASVVSLNSHVCELTVRNKIEAGVASKELVRLSENLETKKVGRPSFRYMTKANASAIKSARKTVKARKSAPTAVLAPATIAPEVSVEITAPVAEVAPEATVAVETPASTEAVA